MHKALTIPHKEVINHGQLQSSAELAPTGVDRRAPCTWHPRSQYHEQATKMKLACCKNECAHQGAQVAAAMDLAARFQARQVASVVLP